ncbi:DUF2190 family protein [Agarilytica rhodophyticola]|uniref:DUF2190 family protein n=1 Tax=Agarilytica rhodophyticola TaxID=1737490 RepID=UPI000B3427D4|nr:capsid cement protein [Agarilytica rhodophyticola]
MKNFVQNGDVLTFTANGAVSSGGVVQLGDNVFGVSQTSVLDGEEGEAVIEGVFILPKGTGVGSAIAQWASVYWDGTAVVDEPTANSKMGVATLAADDAATTVNVKLLPGSAGEAPAGP